MRIDPEELRRHYAMLSDGALLELNRAELTDLAKPIYDSEMAQRNLRPGQRLEVLDEEEEEFQESGIGAAMELEYARQDEPEPDWLEDAACACAFAARSKEADVPIAARAQAALRAAGIPCHLALHEEEPPPRDAKPQYSLRAMVPGSDVLHAMSIVDEHVLNEEHENEWRTTLESLSDKDLQALDPDVFCAGLRDRIARLTHAYEEEMAHRRLQPRRS
jgi:hypothetical protein